jgi:eukaryotic-like serine/threonine-protein kinase
MADDSRVVHLLDELFDDQLTPEEACRDHPELLPEVRKQWLRMSALQAKLEGRFPSPRAHLEEDSQTERSLVRLPQIIGYEVECVLGQGGMGVVYKARHLKLNRAVAIKMLPGGTYAGPHELARFLGEAKAVAGLRHANIVQVHDVGDVEGWPYFTMEFLEGGNLAQEIAGQPQPGRQASEIVAALAGAIQVAHQNGIIHRDLKPANILLTADGTPKISDFGLARRFENNEHLTFSGTRMGTPSYMAPEQALGKRGLIGPAVDIYSLGAVLYEMLTGRPPFRAETARDTERQLLTEEAVPPRRLNAAIPRDLETICLKCLEKNPQRRYETAEALAADLRRFQRGEVIAARPASFLERAGRSVRRHPTLAAALSFGLLLILAALGGALWLIAERQTSRQAIENDLQEAVRLQGKAHWSEAQNALERARARLSDLGFSDLRDLLEQADRDQQAAARFDEIRSNRAISEGLHLPIARSLAEYDSAFRDFGIGDRGDDPALVASRIKRSNIQAMLITAIEDWAAVTEDQAYLDWLLQVARQAAPDPTGWRARALTLPVWTNQSDLAELIVSAPVTENSVPLLLALGERYSRQGGNPTDLFAKCQKVRSHDFWANFWLGCALRAHKNPTESIRYFQAAVAIRPDSGIAYNHLGIALAQLQRIDDAIEMFQAALNVDPAAGPAMVNLSMMLSNRGRHAEAIPKLRTSISFKPGDAMIYGYLGYSLNAVGQKEEAWEAFQHASELDPVLVAHWNRIRVQLLQQGRGDEARTLWRTALAADPPKHDVWDGYAEFCLFLGREDEYRWARRELLARFGGTSDPHIAERTGRACLLLPATEEELRKASALIGRALAADRSKLEFWWAPSYFRFAQGLLAYRQGRFDESSAIMKGDAATVLGPAPGLVLAMDQFRLGQKDEAQKTLEIALKAFDWQPGRADSREAWIYHILRREAERLIKPGALP